MKILLVTLHSQNNNFGSVLQANSLYQFINSLGHEIEILDYRPYYSNGAVNAKAFLKKIITNVIFFPFFVIRSKRFNALIKQESTTKRYNSYGELEKMEDTYDLYMIGSDQVWNPHYLCGKDPAYYLKFINNKKKMSYAASIGTEEISDADAKNILKNIKDFKYVSFREEQSALRIQGAGREDAKYVLDPVFLYDVNHYRNMQKSAKDSGYILAYVIHKDPFIEDVITKISQKLNKKVIQIGGFASKCKADTFYRSAGPYEFLGLMDGADYVITSSFHGTAFAHIYRKQFSVVMPYENQLRLKNILESAGTTDRIINKISDISLINNKIDYEKVEDKLSILKEKSRQYLKQSIEGIKEN